MLFKLANRAFVRAVTHRPLTMSSRLSKLSKIDADMVNYVEQQLGEEKERTLPAIKGWSSVGKFLKVDIFRQKLTLFRDPGRIGRDEQGW